MASIRKQVHIDAPVAKVWDALRDVGALHTRLAPGFVTDTKMDGSARIECELVHYKPFDRAVLRIRETLRDPCARPRAVYAKFFAGDELENGGVYLRMIEIDGLDSELLRQHAHELLLADDLHLDQGPPERSAPAALLGEGHAQGLLAEHLRLYQHLSKLLARHSQNSTAARR